MKKLTETITRLQKQFIWFALKWIIILGILQGLVVKCERFMRNRTSHLSWAETAQAIPAEPYQFIFSHN